MEREEFDKYVKYFVGYMPDNTGYQVLKTVDGQTRLKLLEFREKILDEFCKKHDLCSLCVTGGYNCDSDHK